MEGGREKAFAKDTQLSQAPLFRVLRVRGRAVSRRTLRPSDPVMAFGASRGPSAPHSAPRTRRLTIKSDHTPRISRADPLPRRLCAPRALDIPLFAVEPNRARPPPFPSAPQLALRTISATHASTRLPYMVMEVCGPRGSSRAACTGRADAAIADFSFSRRLSVCPRDRVLVSAAGDLGPALTLAGEPVPAYFPMFHVHEWDLERPIPRVLVLDDGVVVTLTRVLHDTHYGFVRRTRPP